MLGMKFFLALANLFVVRATIVVVLTVLIAVTGVMSVVSATTLDFAQVPA